ncbi:MAG: lipopolysaccharide biosynthesis protein [Acidobacteriia bacterium]|nr:lipopolysaccharide biosynthesis protein [Terriglobia bacterium]
MMPSPVEYPGSELGRAALDRRLVSGVAWTAVARWGGQIVSWASMLLLAKLLSPEDFGLFGMTTLFLGFVTVVSEFGIGSAILMLRELSPGEIRQMHALSLLLGAAGSILSLCAARPVAAFFHNSRLEPLVAVMGIGFLLSGVRVVPQSVLLRDLKFKLVSGLEALMVVVQALASVLLAWLGMRYWSLVLGGLIASAAASLLFYIASPCAFARPVLGQLRGELRYSRRVLMGRVTWYLYSNADFAVAGRFLGEAALGVYNMAWNLANLPLDRIATLIFRVTPSIFSSVQHDAAELRRYLRVLTEGMSLIVFPVGIGVALVADPLVAAAFDKRWAGLAMPLRLLALNAVLRCLTILYGQVQTTIRDVRYGMWQGIVSLAVLPVSFWYASRWGGSGIAAAWLCLYPLLNGPPLFRVLRKIAMPKSEYLRAIAPAGLASAAMAAAVLAAGLYAPALRPLPELLARTALGAAVYLGVLFLFFRGRVNVFLSLVLRPKSAAA